MDITFYTNNSEPNKIDKNLTTLYTLSGTLKEECSITDPVVLIESATVVTANYAYIPDFGRVYFVKDIVNVSRTHWRVSMHCDVLSSFKDEIKACDCVMERNEFDYNLYLADRKMLVETDKFTITNRIGSTDFSGHNNIILMMANSDGYQ